MTDIKESDDDCACGGGAISGHATGCPEAARFASPPSPAESGAVAWMVHDDPELGDYLTKSRTAADASGKRVTPLFQAPSASMGRVTVKALEWSSEPPCSVARVPRLWLFYSTEAVWDDRKFCYAELSGGLASGRFETVAAAKAAAQADYEARILGRLDSPPDHGGGEGWQSMETAPTNGKHCILAVQEPGGFIYSMQGAYQDGQWNAVHRDDVKPLAWMPNVLLPEHLRPLPIRAAASMQESKDGR